MIEPTAQIKGAADRVYVANVGELSKVGSLGEADVARGVRDGGDGGVAGRPVVAVRGRPAPLLPAGASGRRPPRRAEPYPVARPLVTIYGTSWCGACRAARQYMTEQKIPFADKDIESDPSAAQELPEKASKMGIPTDRVPVIDVRGRLLLGFDRARIEAFLGQPT